MNRAVILLAAAGFLSLLPAVAEAQAGGAANQGAGGKTASATQPASGQTQDVSDLPGTLQWLIKQSAKNAQSQAASSSQSTTKQTQSITIDHGSTTLIDQSSGSDLLSTALNLIPVSSGTSTGTSAGTAGTPGSGTVTASAYAVRQLFNPKEDPLAPDVYNKHAAWRRFFFTVGREQLSSNNSSGSTSNNSSGTAPTASLLPRATTSGSTSSMTAQPGTIAGAQVLIWQTRDASNIVNNPASITPLQILARNAAAINAIYTKQIITAVCAFDSDLVGCSTKLNQSGSNADTIVQTTIDALPASAKAGINQIASNYYDAVKKADTANQLKLDFESLAQRPQLSLNFQTTQRTGNLPDDYLAELIFDRGVGDDWLFTFNGSYDYSNSAMIGADLRTERAAVQFSRNIAGSGTPQKSPLQLNLSGEGVHQDTGWHYRAQLQLTIPVTGGVTFPISVGYGNETDALRQEEKGVYGKFGFTFDFGKLLRVLHPQQPQAQQ